MLTETKTVSAGGTILMVEDAGEVRQMVRLLLESHGYKTLEAESAVEALRIWSSAPSAIDLLFVDIVLPGGMSGPQLAARLKTENPKLHVIYTTGYHPASVNEDLTLLEGINFLQKPYDTRTLAQMVSDRLTAR